MSGIQTHLKYDRETTMQNLAQSTDRNINYDFLRSKFENYPTSHIVSTCDGKFLNVECTTCDINKDAMTNTFDNIDYRISIENELNGQTRLLSGGDANKHRPAFIDGKSLESKRIVEPRLCERTIAPTNMKKFTSPYPEKYNKKLFKMEQ